MSKFPIQRFTQTVTIPINNDTEDGAVLTRPLNGILRGYTVVAPNLTGTSFIISILGQRGQVVYTKSSVVEDATTTVLIEANNHPLNVPISNDEGVSVLRIKSTGTPDATGVLTFDEGGNITDGDTVTIGDQVYTFVDTLAAEFDVLVEADVKSQGTIDCGATGPGNGDTITIGDETYTFVTALSAGPTVPFEILLEVDVDDTLGNLKVAINLGAGIGTKYSTGTTQNLEAQATTLDDSAHTLIIESLLEGAAGDAVVFTEDAADTVVDGAGTLGTTQAGAYNGDDTLANLADAINLEDGAGEAGVKYHEDTPANLYVTASAVVSSAITVTAVEAVDDPLDVDTLESSDDLSWGDETLVGGGEAAERVFTVDLLIERG